MVKRFKLYGCFFVLLILGYLVYCLVFAVVDNTIGLTRRTAEIQWYYSMQRGDGKNAIYWARKAIYHENLTQLKAYNNVGDFLLPEDYGMTAHRTGGNLPLAFELNGEYNLALKRYQMSDLSRENLHNIARVLYRMGRYSESFEKYCEFCKEKAETAEPNDFYAQNHLYREIMCHSIVEDSRKFRPYATFHDFCAFMKKEYEKCGRPMEYAKVMELFRRVDSKADSFMYDAERFISDRNK